MVDLSTDFVEHAVTQLHENIAQTAVSPELRESMAPQEQDVHSQLQIQAILHRLIHTPLNITESQPLDDYELDQGENGHDQRSE